MACSECNGEPFGDCAICDAWESPADDPTPCAEPDPRGRTGFHCVYREGHDTGSFPHRFQQTDCWLCGDGEAMESGGICAGCADDDDAGDRAHDLEVGA